MMRRALAACMAAAALLGVTSFGARTAVAALPRLSIVAQDFNVLPDEPLQLTIAMPASLDPAAMAGASIVVTSHQAVESRTGISEALDGDTGAKVDSVTITGDAAALRPDGTWQLAVPTETTTRTRAALRLPAAAVHPIDVRIDVDGDTVADVVTFVHRLPVPDTDNPEPEPMRVAVVAALRNPLTLGNDGTVERANTATGDVESLVSLLGASAVPLSVTAEPALLAALAATTSDDASRAAVTRLGLQLGSHEVLSRPSLPLDPSAAAAAGRRDLYTEWLREGEDLLATTLSVSPSRSTALVDAPLSTSGGSLLRDLGVRLLVLPREQYEGLPNSLSGYTDITQLVRIDVGNGVTVDASVADHTVLGRLEAPSRGAPAAVVAVADLLAARQEVIARGDDPGRHGITLGLPDLGVPTAADFADFSELLAATPGLEPTTIDELGVRTTVQQVEGQPVVVGLPPTVPTDLSGRVGVVDTLTLTGRATASMLPATDPRPAGWLRLASILPSSAFTDEQVTAIARTLDEAFGAVLRSVEVPSSFGVNLTGRSGTIPVSLYNAADIPLEVTVQMSSSKLTFPEGPRTVVLEPGRYTEVRIAITARSNGSIPATLLVTTPEGRLPLAPAVPITARVNAIDGLGNLITGAALLVLLTWWGRHVRRSRRQRLADETADCASRHPVSADRTGAPTADTPPATLPPS